MIDLKSREDAIKKLYTEFYKFFSEELEKVGTEANVVRLHLVADTFDDLNLYNRITPLLQATVTTLAEKKAIARAALWDALVAHHFGSYQDKAYGFIANRVADLEEFVAYLKKLPNLATHEYAQKLEVRLKSLEEKITGERPTTVQPAQEAGPTQGNETTGNPVGASGVEEAGS